MKFLFLLWPLLITACCSYPANAAQVKIIDLPPLTNSEMTVGDYFMVYDTSAGTSKKISVQELDGRYSGGGGDVVGPNNSYFNMLPVYNNTDGKHLGTSHVFMETDNEQTNFYFERGDESQDQGQDVFFNASEAVNGSNERGGKININAGNSDGTADGGQVRIGGSNAPSSGQGGHIELASGDSATGNAGDVIVTPGLSGTNGLGNLVLQDKEFDQWIALLGRNGLQFRHDEDRGLRWYDVDNDFVIALLPPQTMGESFHNRWPASQGNNGDILTLDDSGTGQMSWQSPPGGGGCTKTAFTPNASYASNITWTGWYCYSPGKVTVHYEGITTGGGGSGTNLVLDLPNGYTLDTSSTGYPNAGGAGLLDVCRGGYGYGTSVHYQTIGVPKTGALNTLAVYYQDASSPSYAYLPVANNAPNSQSTGILYTLDCPDISINE